MNLPTSQRCSSTNRHGEPCKAKAVKDGECAMHSGLTDPRAMGAAGGKSTETALRKAARADEELREKAKAALADALDGSDEKRRFEAAKSLFSFRAASPPPEERAQRNGALTDNGRPVTTLLDVLELAIERDIGVISGDPRWQAIGRHILNAAATAANGKEHVR